MHDTPKPGPAPESSAVSMTRAAFHAREASRLLSIPEYDIQLAQAHAMTSRAWSAIGRDQAVTEAKARAGTGHAHGRPGCKAGAK